MSGANTPVKTSSFTPLASPSTSSNNTPRVHSPAPAIPASNPYEPDEPLTFVSDKDEKPKRSAAANFLLRQWQVKKTGMPLVTPRSGGLDAEA